MFARGRSEGFLLSELRRSPESFGCGHEFPLAVAMSESFVSFIFQDLPDDLITGGVEDDFIRGGGGLTSFILHKDNPVNYGLEMTL